MEDPCPCENLANHTDDEDLSDHDSEHNSNISIGDTICFRSVHRKMYVNLDDENSGITWHKESESCLFTIYPAAGQPGNAQSEDCGVIHDGAVVCLFAPNGYFLSFDGERLAANRPYYVAGPSAEFIVQVTGDGVLRNRGKLFLRNRATLRMLEVDTHDLVDSVQEDCTVDVDARFADIDMPKKAAASNPLEVGCFQVQKVFQKQANVYQTPRKRRVSSKWRSRLLVPKLPRYARRFSQNCAYVSKAAPRGSMLPSAMTQMTVSVP